MRALKEVVVVVPVDREVHETEEVAQSDWPKWLQRFEFRAVGHLELQHHNRDHDRQNPVAEGFEPALGHRGSILTAP